MAGNMLIEAFHDTAARIQSDPQLIKKTEQLRKNTKVYKSAAAFLLRRKKGNVRCEVTADTTFHCAQGMLAPGKKTAVLNFANPHEPGGGVLRGARAQEECLCRSSNLYFALDQEKTAKEYYRWHRRNCGLMFSDRLIYSPGVTVFKSDDDIPVLLKQPFEVDVITSAAPYLDVNGTYDASALAQIYRSRIRSILEAAVKNDVDNLVLGAFGCGAFHNDPKLMAQAFYDLLIGEQYAAYFERVVFAIKPSRCVCPNLAAFSRAFA